MKTIFSEEGDLRSVDVLAALVALWREGASGALHFSRSGASAGFHLSAGELTAVVSSEARFETAAILLRAGKLDDATMERLSTPSGGDRALAALKAGVLTKREWRWGEKIRAVEVLSELLTWIEGDYVFDRGAHGDAGEFRLTVPRLILELFLRSRDRGLVLHYLGGADVPLARAPHFDAEFAAFGLTADAEAVVRLIDGKATAARISSEGSAEPFAVEKLLAALVTLGLVHPEFAAPEGARTPGVLEGARTDEPEPPGAASFEREEMPLHEGPAAAEHEGPSEAEVEAYTELDVVETPPEPEPELDADLRMHGKADLDEDEEQSESEPEVGESDIGAGGESDDELSIAAERLRPTLGRPDELEIPVEYERLADASVSEGAPPEVPESRGPRALDSESETRLPLDFATGVGSPERPRPRSGGRLLWLLVLLAAGVGAVILLRGRGGAPTHGAASLQTPSPEAVPTTEAVVLSPMSSPLPTEGPATLPTAAPTAPPPTKAPPARVPTSVPRAAAKPAKTVPAAPPAASASSASSTAVAAPPGATRQAWLDRAARDREKANADRKSHFTIQLELACETSTLVDAWKLDRPAGTLWVLTTPFEGKTCFRVLWGRYATKEAARRALAGVPPFFSSAHNRPAVTAIR